LSSEHMKQIQQLALCKYMIKSTLYDYWM
jgi:hypothetical protein